MTFAHRSVLVTGATSGVGLALANALSGRGARVVVHGRDPVRLAAVADEVAGIPVAADLAEAEGPAHLAASVAKAIADGRYAA